MSEEKIIKSYKGFDKDLRCRGFQYEVGKEYELPEGEKVKVCNTGFHACESPMEVLDHYAMFDDDGYHACTEWLVGTFAGRSFVGKTKRQALKKMCDYFDKTKGTDTVIGMLLVKMGWPSLVAVHQKLFVEGE